MENPQPYINMGVLTRLNKGENIDTRQIIKCAIVSLARYKDFYDLYDNVDKAAIGYAENETPNPADMFSYYSPEQIEKYGALAIEIKLL